MTLSLASWTWISMLLLFVGSSRALMNSYCSSATSCAPCRSSEDVCGPIDNYWENSDICVLPIDASSVGLNQCSGVSSMVTRPIVGPNSSVAGKVHIFQTTDDYLYVTFQMNCPYMLNGPGTSSAPFSSAVYLWSSSPDASSQPQYVDVFPYSSSRYSLSRYTCITYAINLAAVCNPSTSTASQAPLSASNGGCSCLSPTRRPCPPSNLSATSIFIQPMVYTTPVSSSCSTLRSPPPELFTVPTTDRSGLISWLPSSCRSLPPPPQDWLRPTGFSTLQPPQPPQPSLDNSTFPKFKLPPPPPPPAPRPLPPSPSLAPPPSPPPPTPPPPHPDPPFPSPTPSPPPPDPPSPPSPTPVPPPPPPFDVSGTSQPVNVMTIVGIAAGIGSALVAVAALLVIVCLFRRNSRQNSPNSGAPDTDGIKKHFSFLSLLRSRSGGEGAPDPELGHKGKPFCTELSSRSVGASSAVTIVDICGDRGSFVMSPSEGSFPADPSNFEEDEVTFRPPGSSFGGLVQSNGPESSLLNRKSSALDLEDTRVVATSPLVASNLFVWMDMRPCPAPVSLVEENLSLDPSPRTRSSRGEASSSKGSSDPILIDAQDPAHSSDHGRPQGGSARLSFIERVVHAAGPSGADITSAVRVALETDCSGVSRSKSSTSLSGLGSMRDLGSTGLLSTAQDEDDESSRDVWKVIEEFDASAPDSPVDPEWIANNADELALALLQRQAAAQQQL